MGEPIHRWPLTENANDVVGSLNLTNNGSVTFSADGASFNGTNQWLSGTKTLPAAFSFATWVKIDDIGIANQIAIAFCTSGGNNDCGAILNFNGGAKIRSYSGAMTYADSATSECVTGNYPTNQHVLLVSTYAANSQKVYRGAVNVVNGTAAVLGSIDTNFSLGRYGAYNGFYLKGKIADARIYDYPLTASEIAALVAAGPNPTTPTTSPRRITISPAAYSLTMMSGGSY